MILWYRVMAADNAAGQAVVGVAAPKMQLMLKFAVRVAETRELFHGPVHVKLTGAGLQKAMTSQQQSTRQQKSVGSRLLQRKIVGGLLRPPSR